MTEYMALLHALLEKAKAQVSRNNECQDPYRHPSHNDYAEGVAEGLQRAYDLLSKSTRKVSDEEILRRCGLKP